MRLLIIGDHGDAVAAASSMAAGRGAKVRHVIGPEQALDEILNGRGADLLLVEVSLDIAHLASSLLRNHVHLPIIAYGIDTDPRAAVAAIRAGAKEFMPLPPDAELIAAVLEAAGSQATAVISKDPSMERVLALAAQFAPSNASVLITGESGTGKEMVCRFVHAKSRRFDGPFVSVNCAAIPENLLESELFGHEKGAFTGAGARRLGKFEEANGGTLLLDEISEMDTRMQAKLLRAIQEREIDRVGGGKPVRVDIRLLATSNRDLEQAVTEGSFREDLLFRLNVLNLHLPPLRARPADIEVLAGHFIAKYSQANGVPERSLSAEALARLRIHGWRGNVRELENCIHRAVLLATGNEIGIDAISLPESAAKAAAAPAGAGGQVGRTVADVERGLIIDTLSHTFGNRTHAAAILGISIRTLRNKLKQYTSDGLAVPVPLQERLA